MSVNPVLKMAGVVCLWLFAAGCVNLKKVNDYASTSSENIKKFEELEYSFIKACNDRCLMEQLNKPDSIKNDCDCEPSRVADSVTQILYNAIKGYFDGLAKLSDNGVPSYKFDALSKALKEGDFGGVKINKDHVDAYINISSILTRAVTNEYRKKKISQYIGEANDDIKILLNALQFNLVSNLSKTLETKRERIKSYYIDLYEDETASAYEKKKILEDLNAENSGIDIKKQLIVTYGVGLDSIAHGHQKLFDNRNKLDAQALEEELSKYASEIQDIIDKINKLKNQH